MDKPMGPRLKPPLISSILRVQIFNLNRRDGAGNVVYFLGLA